METLKFTQERPDTLEVRALIDELDRHLAPLYPTDSQHGLSVPRLMEEQVTFFELRYEGVPVGCGGIQCVGKEYSELKRMYIVPSYQGKRFGRKFVAHLEAYAQSQGIRIVRLETGIHQKPAIRLY